MNQRLAGGGCITSLLRLFEALLKCSDVQHELCLRSPLNGLAVYGQKFIGLR
jgi:hypothetical protein